MIRCEKEKMKLERQKDMALLKELMTVISLLLATLHTYFKEIDKIYN